MTAQRESSHFYVSPPKWKLQPPCANPALRVEWIIGEEDAESGCPYRDGRGVDVAGHHDSSGLPFMSCLGVVGRVL
jgi:hypothetical protein